MWAMGFLDGWMDCERFSISKFAIKQIAIGHKAENEMSGFLKVQIERSLTCETKIWSAHVITTKYMSPLQ
ncbi:unnamed protein product [Allacma fusca]|uniref:Uncharacterized protein n=1 Tax=Allacma fusca TaxID=39272 RepID=A0A8J2J499_9HEXA|nr:unnamed protein product [Allacma fusca]